MRPPDGSTVLSLIAPKPDSRESEFIGRATHVVFVTEDVLATFQEWRARGVKFSYTPRLKRMKYEHHSLHSDHADQPSVWGGVVTHFKDPDGNSFALVSYYEESRRVE